MRSDESVCDLPEVPAEGPTGSNGIALYHEWLRCIQQALGPGSTVLGAGPDAKSDAPKSQVFGVLARRRAHVGRTLNTGAPSWPGCRLCTLNKSHHHHQVTIIRVRG